MSNLTRNDKLKALKYDNSNISDEHLDLLYYDLLKKQKKPKEKKIIRLQAPPNDPRYTVTLKFVNIILTNMGKSAITDLTHFKDIDRDDIIKKENYDSFSIMTNEIFECFNRVVCRYYDRNKIKNYMLTLLRKLCEEMGFSFTYITKVTTTNNFKSSRILYRIE